MQAKQLRLLEAELWKAADQLRANSKLTASEYSMPVLGLIFLRHAFNRFDKVKVLIEESLPVHPQRGRRPINKNDFLAQNALFLPEIARFDYLVALPESEDIGEAIDNAMRAIEDSHENLMGILPKNYSIFSKDLLRELLRIFNKEVLQKAEGDLFGKIYEYFLNKFAMTGAQEGGEFFTPMSLVQTIVNVIEPDHGIVFDPACGSAGMFVQTGYFIESEGLQPAEKVTFYGQEKAEMNTRLAKMNLAVHGLEGNIQEGNTFYEDKHDLLRKANFVMANPPFNVDGVDKNKEFVKKDDRLKFDNIVTLPKNDNANYLWISYFYNYLKPTGRAGFVMASSASDAGHSERDIREKLVRTGAVDIMMAIGNNFFYTRSLPCTLWFYDRAKENISAEVGGVLRNRDTVLMLDARKIFRKVTQKINDFSPEQLQNIVCIVNLYRGNTEKYTTTLQNYHHTALGFAQEVAVCSLQLQEAINNTLKNLVAFFEKQTDTQTLFKDIAAEAQTFFAEQNQLIEACQNSTIGSLEMVALQCKNIRKHQDKLIKTLIDTLAAVSKDLQLNKNKDWKELNIKEQLDSLKNLQLQLSGNPAEEEAGLLHDTEYYWKQAHWLQIRFGDGEYRDIEGLCKIVSQADIAAKDWSLSPGRYVGVDTSSTDDDADYEERLKEIHLELADLNQEAIALANTIADNFKELSL